MAMLMKKTGIITSLILVLSVVVSTKRGKYCFGNTLHEFDPTLKLHTFLKISEMIFLFFDY